MTYDPNQTVSLEYETKVSAHGIAPANAVVEQIDDSQCRLRTIVLFDPGETIEFSLRSSGKSELTVRGTVASCDIKGHRFIYTMRLDRMSAREIAALKKMVDALDTLDEFVESAEAEIPRAGVDDLIRACARVPVNFDVTYRTPAIDFKPAKAIDISTNGLMMSCEELLVPGVPVELRLRLPGRRSAKELTLGARVVTRQEPLKGTFLYGLALTCVSNRLRGQLDRYVNAARPSQTPH